MQIENDKTPNSKGEKKASNTSKDQLILGSRRTSAQEEEKVRYDSFDFQDNSPLLLTDPRVLNSKPQESIQLSRSLNPYEKEEIYFPDEKFNQKMTEIRGLDSQVKNNLEGIEEKLNNMQEFQETDFLRAYKDQMFVLKKELKHLKGKLDEENLKRLRDEKVQFYMQERDYFRAQALRLENEKNGYIKDINNLKMKLLTIKDDKKYFETFVIEARKENKDLKDEIRQVHESYEKQQVEHARNDYYSKQRLGKKVKAAKEVDFEAIEKEETLDIFNDLAHDEDLSSNAKALAWKNRYMKEKSKNTKLTNKLKEISGNRMDLVYIMQNCVSEVKRDIYYKKFSKLDRNGKYNGYAGKKAYGEGDQPQISQDEINEEVKLNHFSNVDKKSLINNLLSHEEMLNILEKFLDQLGFNERREEFLNKGNVASTHPFKHQFSDRHLMDHSNLKTSETHQSIYPRVTQESKEHMQESIVLNVHRPITASTTTNLKGVNSRPFTAKTTIHNYSSSNIRTNSRIRYGRIKHGPKHGASIKSKDVAESGFESQTQMERRIIRNAVKPLFFEMKV